VATKKPDEDISSKEKPDQAQANQPEAKAGEIAAKEKNGNELGLDNSKEQTNGDKAEQVGPSGGQSESGDKVAEDGSRDPGSDKQEQGKDQPAGETPGQDLNKEPLAAGDPNNGLSKSGKSTQLIDQVYTGVAERTFTESAFHPDSLRRPYNPDKLVMKDWTYRIYEEMLEDDQVNVALQIKKDLVVGNGFYFETETEGQEDIQKDLEIIFNEQTERPFTDGRW